MNTVLVLQPEDTARLLELDKEARELSARLEANARKRAVILTRAVYTEHEESEPTLDLSLYTYNTQILLEELRDAPNGILSKDTIRQYVIAKEEPSDKAVRTLISRVRKEMKYFPNCRYEIETVRGKGYRLVCRETLQNVTKPTKTRKKQRK